MYQVMLALMLAQPQVPDGPPTVPQVPQGPKTVEIGDATQTTSYELGSSEAIQTRKPLVLFIRAYERPVAGAVTCYADKAAGYPASGVVVSVPVGDELQWRATLPAGATDAEIQRAFTQKVKAVQPAADPFSKLSFLDRFRQRRVGRDADTDGSSSLPEEIAFLEEMEPYETARLTQVSGNRSGRGTNYGVDRRQVPSKWSAPGGLDGLAGWSNQLFRGRDNRVKSWLDRANPSDTYVVSGGELWGSEFVFKRKYEDGAKFADVLQTDRGVFEVRLAELIDGRWERSVPYRDPAAAPEGYARVSLTKCAECHDQAGAGNYGSARIPGGHGVLSEKMAQLER